MASSATRVSSPISNCLPGPRNYYSERRGRGIVMASAKAAPSLGAREAMERLNTEAGKLHIWLRTQANAPAQRPWFRETGIETSGQIAAGKVGAAQLKPVPHRWRWSEI